MHITGFLSPDLPVRAAHSHGETLPAGMEADQRCGTEVTSRLILDQLRSVWIPQMHKVCSESART